jgi:hypothetical protein
MCVTRLEEPQERGKRRDRGGSRRFGWSFGRGVPERTCGEGRDINGDRMAALT